MYRYKSRRGEQAELKKRIKEIAETRVRYGYRRIHVLLSREGWRVNVKRVYRHYRELGLKLRNKTPKRRVKAKLREDRQTATGSNEVWAMDFVHDQTAMGTKILCVGIVLRWGGRETVRSQVHRDRDPARSPPVRACKPEQLHEAAPPDLASQGQAP